jgi:large subunit ribosomal protein L6
MVKITEGVNVAVHGNAVTVKGPNGEVRRDFSKRTSIKVDGDEVKVEAKDAALVGTTESLLTSMMIGVTEGFTKKLKVLYSHFPVSIEVKGRDIMIKNFLGERKARMTNVAGDTKVEVKGQDVTVSGASKEDVGQTAANMKRSMKIKDKDGRIFQDGIYDSEE